MTEPRSSSSSGHGRLHALLDAALARAPIDEDQARAALQEMVSAVEELRVADEELLVQAEHLAASAEMIDAERARYAELFDSAPDAYVETDELGKILEANRSAEQLLGLPVRQLMGKLLVSFIDPDERRPFRTLLGTGARDGPRTEQIFTIRNRDGDEVTVGVVRSAPAHPGEPLPRVRWLMRDVTERVQLEGRIDELLDEVGLLRSLEELQRFTDAQSPFDHSLANVVAVASEIAPNCDIGITLADNSHSEILLARSALARELDGVQRSTRTGPCIEAVRDGTWVRGPVTDWPELARSPNAHRVTEVIAIPMAGDAVRGVINVYVREGDLGSHTLRLLELLAEQGATALFNAGLLEAGTTLIANLNRALENRGVIEQAKGLLMAQHRCSPEDAFAMLRSASQRENVKLQAIAERMVQSSTTRRP